MFVSEQRFIRSDQPVVAFAPDTLLILPDDIQHIHDCEKYQGAYKSQVYSMTRRIPRSKINHQHFHFSQSTSSHGESVHTHSESNK